MSLPSFVLYNVGGTIAYDATEFGSQPSTATVTIYSGTNAAIASDQSATVSTISTTLSSAASAGDRTVSVASATGISAGVEFWVRASASGPEEKVRCKHISGTTVTLWRPLLYAHASGATAEGTRITYAVTSAQAATLFWDGRAEWTLDNSVHDYTAVECTKYPLRRHATMADVFDENPYANQLLEDSDDTDQLLDLAHDEVLERIGGVSRVRVRTGGQEFRQTTVFAFLRRLYRRAAGDGARELYERYGSELSQSIERLQVLVPEDTNQNGVIEPSESGAKRSARLLRG